MAAPRPLNRQVTRARRLLAAASEESFVLPGRSERSRWIYPALAELVRRYTVLDQGGEPEKMLEQVTGLTRFEYRVFSQNGEDGVLAELFRRAGVHDGTFVEFGVESGREGSCVFLADVLGWRGLFMEMAPAHFAALSRKYRANPRVRTLQAEVTSKNVEELFDRGGAPEEPDVVAIDVDGHDYWIWQALRRFRPKIVVIEYNSSLDPALRLVQPRDTPAGWSGTDHYGASLGALTSLAADKGYRLAHTELAGVNAFFVRADLPVELPPPEAVPIRAPNHFLAGHAHVPGTASFEYVDLDVTGRPEP